MKPYRKPISLLITAALMLILTLQPVLDRPTASAAGWVPGDEYWHDEFTTLGLNGKVNDIARDSQGRIYAAGEFLTAGGVMAYHIAMWDGVQWQALGAGTDGTILDLAIGPNDRLYVAGAFSHAGHLPINNLALWDGTTWSAVGGGTDREVNKVLYDSVNNALYVGGWMTQVGSLSVKYIARYNLNDSTWSDLGGGTDGAVESMVLTPSGGLYVGGMFTKAGGVPASNIARWDGAAWSALGSGLSGMVYSLAYDLSTNILYAGGEFIQSGSTRVNHIAQWNGSAWSHVGLGTDGTIKSLALNGNSLYVGGGFTHAGDSLSGVGASGIVRWDMTNSAWVALGSGIKGTVETVLTFSTHLGKLPTRNLLVGGTFDEANNMPVGNIVGVDQNDAHWYTLVDQTWPGSQLLGASWGIVGMTRDSKGRLYIGGVKSYLAGNAIMNGPARLEGNRWVQLGDWKNEIGDDITYLAAGPGDVIYAASITTGEGGIQLGAVCRWDGTHWVRLGERFQGMINTIALAPDGTLYAGGSFTKYGTADLAYIARWTGTTWAPLGGGVNGEVTVLAFAPNGSLYVGGLFTLAAGTVNANHITYWNGAWHSLDNGAGANDSVNAIVIDRQGRVYVGGAFTYLGSIAASRVGYWDGAWHRMGQGVDDRVDAMGLDGRGRIFAGGVFKTADGVPASSIAYWDGAQWHPLGSGIDPVMRKYLTQIHTIVSDGLSGVYIAGWFSQAGLHVSNNLAHWSDARYIYVPAIMR